MNPSYPVVFVTGKGGVGKTHITTALAEQARQRGIPCRVIRLGRVGGSNINLGSADKTIEVEEAVRELVGDVVRFKTVSGRLFSSRAFRSVAATTPGLSDLAVIEKIRREREGHKDELILIDGYSSGHAHALLRAPVGIESLVGFGPAVETAKRATRFIEDRSQFCILVVTTPEELPVAEARELLNNLKELSVTSLGTVVNGMYEERADADAKQWLKENPVSPDALWYIGIESQQRQLVDSLLQESATLWPYPFEFSDTPIDEARAEVLAKVLAATSSARLNP